MKVEFKIDENDFLLYQLYTASTSERIKKRRKRTRIIVPVVYLILGSLFFPGEAFVPGLGFILIAIFWYIFYPVWTKRRYYKHYESFIKENYKDRVQRLITTEFGEEFILMKDEGNESRTMISEITEINEIASIIFVKLKTGQSLLLPKNKITEIELLKNKLRELAMKLNIAYTVDEKWEWK